MNFDNFNKCIIRLILINIIAGKEFYPMVFSFRWQYYLDWFANWFSSKNNEGH